MSFKRVIYVLLIAVVAGVSALSGAVAGGVAVYRAIGASQSGGSAAISSASPASTDPGQTLVLSTTNIQTDITQAVQKVGSSVVTVVGTIPGSITFFGQSGDQTVSGSGFFISDSGYILTNNHVVDGTKTVNIVLADGTQQASRIVAMSFCEPRSW